MPDVLIEVTGTHEQIRMVRAGLALTGTITAEGKARKVPRDTNRLYRVRYTVRVMP